MKKERLDPMVVLKLWEKTVDVQMHFNDLSLRIRSFALTALTFTYGAIFVTSAKVSSFKFRICQFKIRIEPASLVAVLGICLLAGFWYMDARWYHFLLRGAVSEGSDLEGKLTAMGYPATLSKNIQKKSRFRKKFPWSSEDDLKEVEALKRLNRFYLVVGSPLFVLAMIFAFGHSPLILK